MAFIWLSEVGENRKVTTMADKVLDRTTNLQFIPTSPPLNTTVDDPPTFPLIQLVVKQPTLPLTWLSFTHTTSFWHDWLWINSTHLPTKATLVARIPSHQTWHYVSSPKFASVNTLYFLSLMISYYLVQIKKLLSQLQFHVGSASSRTWSKYIPQISKISYGLCSYSKVYVIFIASLVTPLGVMTLEVPNLKYRVIKDW